MTNRSLFALWGCLFVLCAGLGFVPERNLFLTLLSLLFFLPPAALLYRAGKRQDTHTLKLLRNLAAASLGLTLVLLVGNFAAALGPDTLGTAVYAMLTVVSTPMVCSGHWAMSLFLWACLLMGSLQLLKKEKA